MDVYGGKHSPSVGKKQITWYRFIKHAVRLYGIVTPKKKEIRVSRMLAKFLIYYELLYISQVSHCPIFWGNTFLVPSGSETCERHIKYHEINGTPRPSVH